MRLGVRARLFLVSISLIASAGVPAGAYLEAELRTWLEGRIDAELTRYAGATRELIEASPDARSIEAADALADMIGRTTSARVTVIAADGTVLGDSDLDDDKVRHIENHARRPEILVAIEHGIGTSRRYSTTAHTNMLYVAVPFKRADSRGTVRVAMALHDVDVAVGRLRTMLLLAGLLGLAVALVMSGLASHLLARTLRSLVSSARAMAAGHRGRRIRIESDDEIAGIAGSLNRMAEELEDTVATLATERDRMEAVLEGMTDAVVALDEHHRVTLVNASAQRLLGGLESPVGRTLAELVRAPALQELVLELGDEPADLEFDLPGPSRARLLAHAARQQSAGGVVLVLRDVTRMRELEAIRRDFVANVSHELRTPVSVIRANAETLLGRAQPDPERAHAFTKAILSNAERLSRLIADLLDLARIEAGETTLDVRRLTLEPAIIRATETLAEAARDKQLALSVDVAPDLAAAADSKALDQVLLNLLDNAVKYTLAGGHVVVRAREADGHVRVEVHDDGPDIDPRHRQRIFERFFRVDPGRSRAPGGTGLGLSIVRHLVESMGGRAGVDPASPHGSVFWFTLPPAA